MAYCDPIKTELENCWDNLETEEKYIVEEESVVPEFYTEDKNTEISPNRKDDLTETLSLKSETKIDCPRVFLWCANLKTHMLCDANEPLYKCDICKRTFRLPHNLRKHEMCHTGQKPHKCEICEAAFRNPKKLTLHMMRHTGEKPHKCQICPKAFRLPCSLRKHMKIHTDHRPHKCEICQKAYRLPINLKSHMFGHKDAKFYKCEFCGKGSWTESWPSTHQCPVRTLEEIYGGSPEQVKVEGRDPFRCPICLKRFIHLKKHMTIHTTERPHKCEFCQKRFQHRSVLKKHMKCHSGKKPLECQTCGRRISCKQNLKRHMKTHEELEKHSFIHTGEMPCSKSVLNPKFTKGHEAVPNTPELEKAIIKPDEIQIDEGGPELQINANSKLVDEEVYNCEFCDENVISKAAFKYHMEEAHFVILEEIGVDD